MQHKAADLNDSKLSAYNIADESNNFWSWSMVSISYIFSRCAYENGSSKAIVMRNVFAVESLASVSIPPSIVCEEEEKETF